MRTDLFLTNWIWCCLQTLHPSSFDSTLTLRQQYMAKVFSCWIKASGISPGTAEESSLTAMAAALRYNLYVIPLLTKSLSKCPTSLLWGLSQYKSSNQSPFKRNFPSSVSGLMCVQLSNPEHESCDDLLTNTLPCHIWQTRVLFWH